MDSAIVSRDYDSAFVKLPYDRSRAEVIAHTASRVVLPTKLVLAFEARLITRCTNPRREGRVAHTAHAP